MLNKVKLLRNWHKVSVSSQFLGNITALSDIRIPYMWYQTDKENEKLI